MTNEITTTLAQQIRAEHEQVGAALQKSLGHALRAGDLLIEAKAQIDHGAWLPWLAEHCGLAERTAQAYMRLARNRHQLKSATVADLGVREALTLLADQRPERPMPVKFTYHVAPRMPPWQYAGLKASIKQVGVLQPISVNRDGEIIDGYERALVCSELGIEDYPRTVITGREHFPRNIPGDAYEARLFAHHWAANFVRRGSIATEPLAALARALEDALIAGEDGAAGYLVAALRSGLAALMEVQSAREAAWVAETEAIVARDRLVDGDGSAHRRAELIGCSAAEIMLLDVVEQCGGTAGLTSGEISIAQAYEAVRR
ncbi:MAG: DUF3102 domain-containing protein [Dehalococcoidia bacterium]